MAEEVHATPEPTTALKKRKLKQNKRNKSKKKMKMGFKELKEGKSKTNKTNSLRMKKLFKKRVREYNSDDEDDDGRRNESAPDFHDRGGSEVIDDFEEEGGSDDGGEGEEHEERGSNDEGDEIQPGVTKFAEGVRAFKVAFMKIMSANISDDMLGPVLSGHKKLIAEKLAEEEAERGVKGEAKKERHLVAEKGHVKPANFLDTKEKFLISVATKGVVKLFNAVNKAQNAQKGLNPSKFKDAKVLGKRRKEAFFSELRKTSDNTSRYYAKGGKSTESDNNDEPKWAPLRDSFMLTNSKWKDWDKMPDPCASVPDESTLVESSDDE